MRWDGQQIESAADDALPGLAQLSGFVRSVRTPEFAGVTFHEVLAKSALNKVPAASQMPFRWTVNPYRGCSHACVYCLAGDTPILMGDGRTKPLADVRVGDEVYGTERVGRYRRYVRTPVLNHWATAKPAFAVELEDGTKIIASGDHRFLTERGWKFVVGEGRGRACRPHLTSNNSLLGVGALAPPPKESREYQAGYLTGMIRGDGHLGTYDYNRPGGQGGVYHRFRLALADREALDRSRTYLETAGIATTEFEFSPASETRRQMQAIRASSRLAVQAVRRLIGWPVQPSLDWRKGFLAGIFDAEGSHSTGILRISNTDNEIIAAITEALEHFDFRYAVEANSKIKDMRIVRLVGGLRERLRFLHTVGPAVTRKLDIEGMALKSDAPLGVVAVRPLGLTVPMFDITTGTGDFIANGVVSHNCFARNTHTYLDFDAGDDFDRQVVVKTNVADVLRREVARRSWSHEHVALGTNTDPYQRAEGRYQLMPGIIEALAGSGTPFSILTKGTLARRDLPLLQEAARQVEVSMAVSLALLDPELHRSVEPGTPSPRARLDLVRAIRDAGLPCGVLIAPVLPWLTDSAEHLEALVAAVAEAGATGVTFIPLHLRPGAREWFMQWLGEAYPQLVARYRRLYRTGSYLPGEYREWLRRRTEPILRAHDFAGRVPSHRGAESTAVAPGSPADLIRSPTLF